MYSHIPISFTIQFQTLIFVIFANRANVRVVCKILENLMYLQYSRKTLYYFGFLNFQASLPMFKRLVYLCLNSFGLPMFSLRLCVYIGSFFLLFFLLSRPILVLLVFCFCTCFVLLFMFVSIFHLLDSKKLYGLNKSRLKLKYLFLKSGTEPSRPDSPPFM